jgi:hypothetical protein
VPRTLSIAALAALAIAGCPSVTGFGSSVKTAVPDCLHCMPGTAVAVGVPITLQVRWEKCSSMEARCQRDTPPFQIAASCDAMKCDVVDVGGGYLEITPTATGTTHVVVKLADQKTREERLGPIDVLAPTGIDLACTFMRPASDVREPCADGVPAGADVHVVMLAKAGERTLAHPMPRDVSVDGRPILAGGDAVGGTAWECRLSSESDDRLVPEVRKCVRRRVPPGVWTIEARLPGTDVANQLRVEVRKPPK